MEEVDYDDEVDDSGDDEIIGSQSFEIAVNRINQQRDEDQVAEFLRVEQVSFF